MIAAAHTTLLRLDGPVLRDVDDGEIARLGDDGRWRAPDGALCESVGIPAPAVRAIVSDAAQTARNREVDAAWLAAQLPQVAALAASRDELTADDVWAVLTMAPRQARMLGVLLNQAAARGPDRRNRRAPTLPARHQQPTPRARLAIAALRTR